MRDQITDFETASSVCSECPVRRSSRSSESSIMVSDASADRIRKLRGKGLSDRDIVELFGYHLTVLERRTLPLEIMDRDDRPGFENFEADVLRMRDEGFSLREIGEEYGLSGDALRARARRRGIVGFGPHHRDFRYYAGSMKAEEAIDYILGVIAELYTVLDDSPDVAMNLGLGLKPAEALALDVLMQNEGRTLTEEAFCKLVGQKMSARHLSVHEPGKSQGYFALYVCLIRKKLPPEIGTIENVPGLGYRFVSDRMQSSRRQRNCTTSLDRTVSGVSLTEVQDTASSMPAPDAVTYLLDTAGRLERMLMTKDADIERTGIWMTTMELRLMRVLMLFAGRCVSRRVIASAIYYDRKVDDIPEPNRVIGAVVSKLRRKLPAGVARIETSIGYGYSLVRLDATSAF